MEGIDTLVKKASYALKWFETYVILLKAKGKENIVWMLYTSKLSGFYFATYCIIQSKMLIVCVVLLFEFLISAITTTPIHHYIPS